MEFKKGDLIKSVTSHAIIAHVCNNRGLFDAGFARGIRKAYPHVAEKFSSQHIHLLSDVQVVRASVSLIVANMVCMDGVYSEINTQPLSYHHLKVALGKVRNLSEVMDKPVHMPKIGSGYARGDWDKILPLIEENLPDAIIWEL